jgi:tricorn protease
MSIQISRRPLFALLIFLVLALMHLADRTAMAGNVDLPRYPSISPDGSKIVFSWRGDLWKVDAAGGTATRLTSHQQDDLESAWSRCGTMIAFNSTRDGHLNIWLMNADGTNIRQVTNSDRACRLTGFGMDENGEPAITFSGFLEADVYRGARPYMVSLDGGDLLRVHDAFGSHPTVSPDGSIVAFTRGGRPSSWERRHYRGPDAKQVWLFHRDNGSFTQLTHWAGDDGNARWAADDSLIYISDRELDTVNLYRMPAARGDAVSTRLTNFAGRDVQHFDVSSDGRTAVLLVWDTLYTLDLTNARAQPQELSITASEDDRDNYELVNVARRVTDAALSPDGQVMAYIAYGRVYVRNIDDKSPTRLVTVDSDARHNHVAWSPDGLKLYFSNDEDGTESIYAATVRMTRSELKEAFEEAMKEPQEEEEDEPAAEEAEVAEQNEEAPDVGNGDGDAPEDRGDDQDGDDDTKEEDDEAEPEDPTRNPKRWHDAVRFDIHPIISTEHHDRMPSPSPDGKYLAFRRSRGDLMLLDLDTGDIRRLVAGWDRSIHWRWSPCASRIAYAQNDLNFSSNIFIIDVEGKSAPANITRHPRNDAEPRWSADGRILVFRSNRTADSFDVWRVYLDRDLESLTPKELDEYYEDARRAARRLAPLPVDEKKRAEAIKKMKRPELHLDDAWLRISRLTSFPQSEFNVEMTPGGDRIVFTADIDGRSLFSIKWDGSDRKRLTGNVSVQHVSITGDKLVFVSGGRAGTVPPGGGSVENVDISDSLRIDLQAQSSQKFREAARTLGEMFYHHDMKGLDWEQITDDYHQLARQTRTADEFNYVSNRFLGELNASHMGVRASDPSSPLRQSSGRLGTIHHPITLNDGTRGFKVTEVISKSPADLGSMALVKGDIITAIELEPFSATDTIESRLQGRIGDETIVTILREQPNGNGERIDLNALITPISFGAFSGLRYRHWRLRNAEIVEELSDGRIGYIHIQGMNQPSLDVYERDLYAAAGDKEGLIIDVRNNGGGWTTDRLLASIMAPDHAYTIPRGADPNAAGHYPQDRLFIQRYTLPINMLCNEKSFSNAEIISHAFKTLGRGTLVGQQTHGGVISTGGFSLIDGTSVRLPFRGWYTPDGTDMENNGAMPDILIPQTPEMEAADDDAQLRAAVEDLLRRLP